MAVIQLTWGEIDRLVDKLASRLPPDSCCWGVPRGGSVVAALLRSRHGVNITADWNEATIAVDDIIDSGRTAKHVWRRQGLRVEPLIVKENTDWIVFPWEGTELSEDAEHTVTRFLEQIGEDPNRPELEKMPRRVVRFWEKLFSGYGYSNEDLPVLLQNGSTKAAPAKFFDDMVLVKGIPFVSTCERHLLPFYGLADVGYILNSTEETVRDVSTVVDVLARRLQVQTRLTEQICSVLQSDTEGAAVLIQGNYLCPLVQGRNDRDSSMETVSFNGLFESNEELRNRFLSVSGQGRNGNMD